MYSYYTGIVGVLVMGLSMLTSTHLAERFITEFPYLFWGGHVIYLLIVLSLITKTWFNWEDYGQLTRSDFYRSLIFYIVLYILGWSGVAYSGPFALVIGIVDVYITRRRAGLIK
ncbi:hypothetical protein [Dolosigranulum savutiense]|uniref:Uncharacterized protein n=1 Tax=Dolosigranulum savutiense TaxID=3110288 RepID=A0AB74U3W8_9LACT